jgi:hypothetical protein
MPFYFFVMFRHLCNTTQNSLLLSNGNVSLIPCSPALHSNKLGVNTLGVFWNHFSVHAGPKVNIIHRLSSMLSRYFRSHTQNKTNHTYACIEPSISRVDQTHLVLERAEQHWTAAPVVLCSYLPKVCTCIDVRMYSGMGVRTIIWMHECMGVCMYIDGCVNSGMMQKCIKTQQWIPFQDTHQVSYG